MIRRFVQTANNTSTVNAVSDASVLTTDLPIPVGNKEQLVIHLSEGVIQSVSGVTTLTVLQAVMLARWYDASNAVIASLAFAPALTNVPLVAPSINFHVPGPIRQVRIGLADFVGTKQAAALGVVAQFLLRSTEAVTNRNVITSHRLLYSIEPYE